MSTLIDKVKMATESATDFIKDAVDGKPLKLQDEEIAERRETCENCEHLGTLAKMKYCKICGCSITLKSMGASWKCPEGKWKRKE